MAKHPTSPRPKEAPAPAAEAAARIASRRKTADRRLRILERLTNRHTVAHIARAEQLTAPAGAADHRGDAGQPRYRSARRLCSIPDRAAERSDDRRAHDDNGGQSPGEGSIDRVVRTRPLSRLRAGPNSRGAGGGGAAPRQAGALLDPAEIRPSAKSKGNFPPLKPLKFLETRKESRNRRRGRASPRRSAARSRRIPRAVKSKGNFPPRKPLKSLKTAKEFPEPPLPGLAAPEVRSIPAELGPWREPGHFGRRHRAARR